jgi:lysophospholipase L1-like esterase
VLAGVNNLNTTKAIDVKKSTEKIKHDLQAIYDLAHRKGVQVVAVTLTPWKGYEQHGEKVWDKDKQRVTEAINQWILSKPRGVTKAVDVYSALEDPLQPDALRPSYWTPLSYTKGVIDALHPRNQGQVEMGKRIAEAFDSM